MKKKTKRKKVDNAVAWHELEPTAKQWDDFNLTQQLETLSQDLEKVR